LEEYLNLEQRYRMASQEFFRRWQAGELADTADSMDWNMLYQMASYVLSSPVKLKRGIKGEWPHGTG